MALNSFLKSVYWSKLYIFDGQSQLQVEVFRVLGKVQLFWQPIGISQIHVLGFNVYPSAHKVEAADGHSQTQVELLN